jgi:hypothetical protein
MKAAADGDKNSDGVRRVQETRVGLRDVANYGNFRGSSPCGTLLWRARLTLLVRPLAVAVSILVHALVNAAATQPCRHCTSVGHSPRAAPAGAAQPGRRTICCIWPAPRVDALGGTRNSSRRSPVSAVGRPHPPRPRAGRCRDGRDATDHAGAGGDERATNTTGAGTGPGARETLGVAAPLARGRMCGTWDRGPPTGRRLRGGCGV